MGSDQGVSLAPRATGERKAAGMETNPRRIEPGRTSYGSVAELAAALKRAAAAHGEHEARIGAADPDWPEWYAAWMAAEAAGTELPT